MATSTWSRWVTVGAVLLLAVIATVVSYSHMYEFALRHGEPVWRAALFPLLVDGMIVASSMTLLSDARNGRKGGLLFWTLLIIGSGASLAANVAVADPTAWSRIIHAWPSFALIGAYELLMREFRTAAQGVRSAFAAEGQSLDPVSRSTSEGNQDSLGADASRSPDLQVVSEESVEAVGEPALSPFQARAWRWAVERQQETGELPSGREIAGHFGHKERWGRLVKQHGQRQDAHVDLSGTRPRSSGTEGVPVNA